MANAKTGSDPDRSQLHQLISGLRDGVILLGLDQRVLWANEAALKMHGAGRIEDLGCDVDDYRKRFRLTYRNQHPVKGTGLSIEGVLAGERSDPIVVEVRLDAGPDQSRVHALRFQVITKDDGEPDFIILVVEDDYYLAADAETALTSAGADVFGPCGDEESGLEMVRREAIDCAVLDVNLGPGPSFKLAGAMRLRNIPFVFVTGYDREAIPEEFSDVQRLQKPYVERELLSAIGRLV